VLVNNESKVGDAIKG